MRPLSCRATSASTAFLLCMLSIPASHAQTLQARVISISSDTFNQTDAQTQRCLPSLISAHEKALRDNPSPSWMLRYAPIAVGAVLGGVVGLKVADRFGLGLQPRKFQKWERPGAGALGAVAGGLLGWWVTEQLFPVDPAAQETPQVGVPMSDQVFLTETTCTVSPTLMPVASPHYLVTYQHDGRTHTAQVKNYPGASIALTTEGRPVDEVVDEAR